MAHEGGELIRRARGMANDMMPNISTIETAVVGALVIVLGAGAGAAKLWGLLRNGSERQRWDSLCGTIEEIRVEHREEFRQINKRLSEVEKTLASHSGRFEQQDANGRRRE